MRNSNFLRTPIRFDHQGRMQNLQVSEQPPVGNPDPHDPYPQTLQITFSTNEQEVQIAALWEGVLRFVPDNTTGYPQNPQDVTEENFSNWSVVGDLLLDTVDFSLREPFATHIPLIIIPPSLVRYSQVRLTREFIFSTLRQVQLPIRLIMDGEVTTLDDTDPLWQKKLALSFLHGKAGVWCRMDPTDPASDFTNKPMPSVAFAPAGPTTLSVSASSRAIEILAPTWFYQQPDYDNIPGVSLMHPNMAPTGNPTTSQGPNATVLIDTNATFQTSGIKIGTFVSNVTDGGQGVVVSVDSEIQLTHTALTKGTDNNWEITDTYQVNNFHEQLYNPAHPGHSVIPLGAIFTTANDEALEDQHRASALQIAISSIHGAAAPYRRIDIIRPPRPGTPVSSGPQRPFPQYRLNWKKTTQAAINSLRLPLSGHVYIPIESDQYKFWAIPRSQDDPQLVSEGDQLQLSLQKAGLRYIDMPAGSVSVDILTGTSTAKIFAHLFEYDSRLTWNAFASLNVQRDIRPAQRKYAQKWDLKNSDGRRQLNFWFLWPQVRQKTARMNTYQSIYGHIVAAAGRHGIAPEFLQTVLFGEGIDINYIRPMYHAGDAYNPNQVFDTWLIGLDKVGGLRAADPTAGYYQEWIGNSYVDPSFGATVTNPRNELNEAGPYVRVDITGYQAVIEWTATQLHFGLDWMTNAMQDEGREPVTTEEERRLLAYVFFNSYRPDRSRPRVYRDIPNNLKPWGGPYLMDYSNPDFARFNALWRLAVSQSMEELAVYR